MRIRTKLLAVIGGLTLLTAAVAGIAVFVPAGCASAVGSMKSAASRTLNSERLNHLVTAILMESRVEIARNLSEPARGT